MEGEKYWRIWWSEKKFIPAKFLAYVSSTCFVEYHVTLLLLRYFKKDDCFPTTPIHGSTLKGKEIDKANQLVKVAIEKKKASARGHYSNYTNMAIGVANV